MTADTDPDGIGDELDTDDDNDGILDVDDADPLNVDHLVLGLPMPTTSYFNIELCKPTAGDQRHRCAGQQFRRSLPVQ